MRVFVTGATGFVGRALVVRLRRDQHDVIAWTRSAERAREALGDLAERLSTSCTDDELRAELSRCDGVVNLAGEPVVGKRWTASRRRALIDSRVAVTERLVAAIAAASPRPSVLVSASAVGYYGDRGDELLNEDSEPGDDFLASLCRSWEAAARRAEAAGVRVVRPRLGVVLGRGGGALKKLLPVFSAGLGGPMGKGDQFMSWVHLYDVVSIIAIALTDERYRGAINATAPEPATNRELARQLGRTLDRPAVLPLPAVALRVLFGESGQVLLASQRALPAALDRLGFRHEYADLGAALRSAVSGGGIDRGPDAIPVSGP